MRERARIRMDFGKSSVILLPSPCTCGHEAGMMPDNMEKIAQLLIDSLPDKQTFCLFMFNESDVMYITNVNKKEVIILLKEFLANQENVHEFFN